MISYDLEKLKNHYGVCPKMCHNCAFRSGSGEVMEFAAPFDGISQLGTILDAIDAAVEGEAPYRPFFCHQGMPTDDGGLTFQPEIDPADGTPVGYQICAGWLTEVALQQKDERRNPSTGKRFSSIFRVYDRIRKQQGGDDL